MGIRKKGSKRPCCYMIMLYYSGNYFIAGNIEKEFTFKFEKN